MVGHNKWSKIKRLKGALGQFRPIHFVKVSSPTVTARLMRPIEVQDGDHQVPDVHSNFEAARKALEKISG
jgi:hypothetical protein